MSSAARKPAGKVQAGRRDRPVRLASAAAPSAETEHVGIWTIFPSPENDDIYGPVPEDDETRALASSLKAHGVLEPLVITADDYIVSGHRRYAAARLAGIDMLPVRRLAIRKDDEDDPDGFVRLLREHNRQRDKSNLVRLREELVDVSVDAAARRLYEVRREKAALSVPALETGHVRIRSAISPAKRPMLDAVKAVVRSRKAFWPLSDRQIHYALLNNPPLRHASKPGSTYANDRRSYGDLCDLLLRARLAGEVSMTAIADETRPVSLWDVHANPRGYVRREIDDLFGAYWRDLMQGQTNHFELIAEKNTLGTILRPIAADYAMPFTIGRGYCSLPPRHAIAERYRRSGREMLVLLFVSDFDPEGESIAESFGRSMRDDFGIHKVHPIKVALTAQQVKDFKLVPMMTAKKKSSRRAGFVRQHGESVFELEALAPEDLQKVVRQAIEAVIDRDAFTAEVEAERQDAAFLEKAKRQVRAALGSSDFGAPEPA